MLDDGREALVVDPGEAAPVVSALDARALTLAGILVTHRLATGVADVALPPKLAALRDDSRVDAPTPLRPWKNTLRC